MATCLFAGSSTFLFPLCVGQDKSYLISHAVQLVMLAMRQKNETPDHSRYARILEQFEA